MNVISDYHFLAALVLGLIFGYSLISIALLIDKKIRKPKQRNHSWLVSYIMWESTSNFKFGHMRLFSFERYDTDQKFKEMHEYIANDLGIDTTKLVLISINKL